MERKGTEGKGMERKGREQKGKKSGFLVAFKWHMYSLPEQTFGYQTSSKLF